MRIDTVFTATDDHSSVSSKTKEHKSGWLKRKLFHHPSTTFQYKARTTYRPIPKKKSFIKAPPLTDGGRKDILNDKTLEETCRLGGLGVLVLPTEYAVDRLAIPTCLSAAATYLLKHGMLKFIMLPSHADRPAGVNAPGLFRVSGQTATVNMLYDHYAHGFYQAGSPSKVQETVKPGLLPTDVEYAISDVASLFKKILNALPGGLLGSLDLFEAIRAILLNLTLDPELLPGESTSLRAKLVALAILSVTSTQRACLIQAVLGLVAYFAHEAETEREALNTGVNVDDNATMRKPSHELMGYQSFGVCLGPLLLGDLIDRVVIEGETTESEPRTSTESAKKPKKKRIPVAANKMDKDTHLAAHVERANLTASLMQRLLMIWKDVVTQLRIIQTISKSSKKPKNERQSNKSSSRFGSRLTLRSSDDDSLLMDLLRGRSLPEELPEGTLVKEKVKFKRTSSMPRIMVKAMGDSPPNRTWVITETEPMDVESHQAPPARESKGQNNSQPVEAHILDTASRQWHLANGDVEAAGKPLISDTRMDRMTMGQILPSRDGSRLSPESSQHRRSTTLARTPRRARARTSSDITPETAIRDLPKSDEKSLSNWRYYSKASDKPLPPLKDNSGPPSVTTSPMGKQRFPTRQSSLDLDRPLPMKPQITPETYAKYEAREQFLTIDNRLPVALQFSKDDTAGHKEPDTYKDSLFAPVPRSFSEREKTARQGDTKDNLTVIPAYINPLPTPLSPLEDPFTTSVTSNSTRDTLIPKPVHEAGRNRRTDSRPPSPSKTAISYKRASPDSTLVDADAETVKRNTIAPSRVLSGVSRGETGSLKLDFETVRTRPLSAYTADALLRVDSYLKEPPTAQPIHIRNVSFESPSLTTDKLATPPVSLATIKRSGSNNATLYAEITRLKRQLEQKTEEVKAARRSLDAARATQEEGVSEDNCSKRGSWNKGTLSAEVREAKKEMINWKRRAEWAEKRLGGLGALAPDGAGIRQALLLNNRGEEVEDVMANNPPETAQVDDAHDLSKAMGRDTADDINSKGGMEKATDYDCWCVEEK